MSKSKKKKKVMSVSINNPNKPTQILTGNKHTKNPNYSKEPMHDKQNHKPK